LLGVHTVINKRGILKDMNWSGKTNWKDHEEIRSTLSIEELLDLNEYLCKEYTDMSIEQINERICQYNNQELKWNIASSIKAYYNNNN
tara:strand:+ start:33 stop:296 length:264 start_codon:yes stop_codon:yes gene_type:complete